MTTIHVQTYESEEGNLRIRINETNCDQIIEHHTEFQFTRYSDGKIFERQMSDDQIKNLHQIFFDTSLILDILEVRPVDLRFTYDQINDSDKTSNSVPGGPSDGSCVDNDTFTKSEIIEVTWKFTLQCAKQRSPIPIKIQIPEKQCSDGSDRQVIELTRSLAIHGRRIIELESQWTDRISMEGVGSRLQYIPKVNVKYLLTTHDIEWLSSSVFGAATGLDKYFLQFKNADDMKKKIASGFNTHSDRWAMVPNRNVCEWLQENGLEFNEVRSAEFNLNMMTDNQELELLCVRSRCTNQISGTEITFGATDVLYGYFCKSNPRKPMTYVIHKTTDPCPPTYESAIYLRDAYKCVKKNQIYPLISDDKANQEKIAYNSQWVIYKICV
jgi:hypothetical protein